MIEEKSYWTADAADSLKVNLNQYNGGVLQIMAHPIPSEALPSSIAPVALDTFQGPRLAPDAEDGRVNRVAQRFIGREHRSREDEHEHVIIGIGLLMGSGVLLMGSYIANGQGLAPVLSLFSGGVLYPAIACFYRSYFNDRGFT